MASSSTPPLRHTLFAWFYSREAWLAWLCLCLLIVLTLVSIALSVRLNHFIHDFYQAINERRRDAFFTQIGVFFVLVLAVVAEVCARAYLSTWTSFRWRQWMTQHYQGLWLHHNRFYRIPYGTEGVDNPDQRISQDIASISSGFISLALSLFRAALSAISFLCILYQLTATLHVSLGHHQYRLTVILICAALLYAICMTAITMGIAHPLFHLNIEQEKREADFRYQLMRIREYRMPIAALGGSEHEEHTLHSRFRHIAQNFMQILKRTLYLNLFQNFYGNMMPFLPLIIAGPLFFQGMIGFGILMQIHDVFNRINESLSIIALSYTDITAWMAAIQRIRRLEQALHTTPSDQRSIHKTDDKSLLRTQDLVLYHPDQRILQSIPDMVLHAGDCYQVVAPSGWGKSTWLRALRGLYHHYTGTIEQAAHTSILLLPEEVYIPEGSLATAARYPSREDACLTAKARTYLADYHLAHLYDHWYLPGDYAKQLSAGEKQRLQLMRIVIQSPNIALLDESFSHLHITERTTLLAQVRQHCPHTALLIVTHDPFDGIPTLWPSLHPGPAMPPTPSYA